MPMLDPYETQSAIALIRQHKDYEHWYDKAKLTLKDVVSTLYIAAMNPTAGSFVVNPRLQRHFWLCAIQFPEPASLITIYSAYLQKHFSEYKANIQEMIQPLIKATLNVQTEMERSFKKTAINFHYEFNVRHLTNVFQGVLMARIDVIKDQDCLVRLWCHELERIYGDRLVNASDLEKYRAFVNDISKKTFPRTTMTKYFQVNNPEPLVFANFVESLDDKKYDQFASLEALSTRL
jgi:dynein heavy chain